MKISIIYSTGRHDPCLDWMLEGLDQQAQPGDEIELIVVDVLGREAEEIGFAPRPCIDNLIEIQPKPSVWQGAHRVTTCDWWALSNARNTGLIYATSDFVAFLDDRCWLGPNWLATVRKGYIKRESVLAGSYEKHETDLHAPPGQQEKLSVDHRFKLKPQGMTNCGGGWLYGCTLALPLKWALEVNGFEEGCDGLGMEDVIFGLNLQNAGRRIDFVPSMFTKQERSVASFGPVYRKTDKGISPNDKSHAALARFGKRKRTELTPDLCALRELVVRGGALPIPDPNTEPQDWYDGTPIRGMT